MVNVNTLIEGAKKLGIELSQWQIENLSYIRSSYWSGIKDKYHFNN